MESSRNYTDPVYTIGIAAKMVNLSVHSLRLYEAEGLIITYKTETGRRLYSDLEIEKIKCIHSMVQEQGLNFEGIRQLLGLVPCWKLRDCNSDCGMKCNAFLMRTAPCWATEEKCIHPLPSCRDCPVYQNLAKCDDVRRLIHDISEDVKTETTCTSS